MPDDYYVLQRSGEEIEELLDKAGSATGAVRYDAAQTLADAQKTQARRNINAAPGGFGLGDFEGVPIESSVEGGLNTAVKCGWYYFGGDGSIANAPSLPGGGYGTLLVSSRSSSSTVTQICFFETVSTIAIRRRVDSEWQPWEYLNPPMQLGVEYRTTERYLDKPVYVKMVDFGSLPNNTLKIITFGDSAIKMISAHGIVTGGYVIPGCTGSSDYPTQEMQIYTADGGEVGIYVHADRSNLEAVIVAKYWKTTD